jgi:FtsH-binding integral membrane protein
MTITIPIWALWVGIPILIVSLAALGLFAFMGYIYIDLLKVVGSALKGEKKK